MSVAFFFLFCTAFSLNLKADHLWTLKGSDLVSGSSYSFHSYSSMTSNPAIPFHPDKTSDNTHSIHLNIANSTTSYELVNVNKLRERIDNLLQEFGTRELQLSDVDTLKEEAESILSQTSDHGQIIGITASSNRLVPSLRLSLPQLNASLFFDYKGNYLNAPFTFGLSVNSAPVSIEPAECLEFARGDILKFQDCYDYLEDRGELDKLCSNPEITATCEQVEIPRLFELVSDTTIELLGVSSYDHFSLGYSSRLFNDTKTGQSAFIGVRFHHLIIETFAYTTRLTDVKKLVLEKLAEDIQKTENIKNHDSYIDLGFHWSDTSYQVGATVTRLLADSVFYATSQAKQIHQSPLASIHGSYFLFDGRTWVLNGHLDLNSADDLLGQPHQWVITSLAYNNTGKWLPSAAIGVRKSLSGNKLSYFTLGFKALGFLRANAAYSIERIGNVPRSVILNFGIEWTI